MRTHDFFRIVVLCIAGATLDCAPPLDAQSVQPTLFEETGVFSLERLRESSGVAVSRTMPGILWTHNDSGDRARIYATNLKGEHLGRFRVRAAEARDWEDIALGPCPGNHGIACLYIADTGDNDGNRSEGIIYIVPEPDIAASTPDNDGRTEGAHKLRVAYPNGPRDIEALAVTPDGDLLLITKGTRGPIVIYSVAARHTRDSTARAVATDTLARVPARRLGSLVTAAAVSPSGKLLAVRTYTEIYFFDRTESGHWRLFSPPCWLGLRQPQGEAVDFLDETSVVVTSESAMGRRGGLARVVCPIGEGSAAER